MRHRKIACALLALASASACASEPRWVTGTPYYYPPGLMVVWYTDQPQYFTDQGDLSPHVNHAAADALVAAAAGVWTVPTSRLILSYGGSLDEDVSGTNVTFGASGITFPADVQNSNYAAKQIAVIYDSDGSITDLMLGSGASNPANCRTAAVTESVDSIWGNGHIMHAILVLNGRCTGPAPEQQLQLQYQLMRAFGRILGIGWSQTNDNVFTGTPRPNYNQALHWPIMHPIDIICGPYTYQCLPQPFTLRPDDISSLGLLYPVYPPFSPPAAPGKQDTLGRANRVKGHVTFPNGQGMAGVNVVVHRIEPFWDIPEDWETASGVTGILFRRDAGNPVTGTPPAAVANMGTTDPEREGYYDIFQIPLQDWEDWQNLIITTQPINPLYIGPYAVGPYEAGSVTPSGSPPQLEAYVMGTYSDLTFDFTIPDAVSSCNTSADGTESAPSVINGQGWWSSTLCGYGHTAWSSFTLQAQRSATLEITAQDEGYTTSTKAMPVVGLWKMADPTGTLPTIAGTSGAFNTGLTGVTSLAITSAPQPQQLRMVVADQRGDGRPDFAYKGRLLYADSITPATVSAGGGSVTIQGMGFRQGNAVTVNGVSATVLNSSATAITLTAPSLHDLHSTTALTADVVVRDLVTGGQTSMAGALTYNAQPSLALVSAPSGTIFTRTTAATPLTVQALQADGFTPIAGQTITFTVTAGQALLGACNATVCVMATDALGRASTTMAPLAAGRVTLSAASAVGTQSASFTAIERIQTITTVNPTQYIAAGAVFRWTPEVVLADNGASTIDIPVQWQSLSSRMSLNSPTSFTNLQSLARNAILSGPLESGDHAQVTACAWNSVCTTFSAVGVSPAEWQLQFVSGSGQSITTTDHFDPVMLRVVDSQSHPIGGAEVQVNQTLEPWSVPCPAQGRCPIAPVYQRSTSTVVSDANGLITITPIESSQAEVTSVAGATGTQGFLSFTLVKQP